MSSKDIKLKPHQLIPIKFLKNNRSVILYHSTGSGKTITALKSVYQFDKDIIIIGPKSSRKAFFDEMDKFDLNPLRVTFYTYAKIKLILESELDILTDKCVIVDEAHNLRNETTNNLTVITALTFAHKVVLMTATPVINYMNDMAVLINIARNQDVLPTDRNLFNHMFYNEEEFKIMNEDNLLSKMKNCISYYKNADNIEDYPKFDVEYISLEMNKEQIEEYILYVKKYLYDSTIISDINKNDLLKIDLAEVNRAKKNFFLSGTRQLSNTLEGQTDFPKIQMIYNKIAAAIKAKEYPIIVYSNYLKNGIYCIAELLELNNITYKTITGNTTDNKISFVVNSYNQGKFKVLLISSAGSESLDLKNTRQIHIMEPHWNEPRITQVIGRAIRYKSHSALKKKDRHVMIYRYAMKFPEPILNQSADEHLISITKKKDDAFHLFDELIQKASIENVNQHGGNDYKITYKINKTRYKELQKL